MQVFPNHPTLFLQCFLLTNWEDFHFHILTFLNPVFRCVITSCVLARCPSSSFRERQVSQLGVSSSISRNTLPNPGSHLCTMAEGGPKIQRCSPNVPASRSCHSALSLSLWDWSCRIPHFSACWCKITMSYPAHFGSVQSYQESLYADWSSLSYDR